MKKLFIALSVSCLLAQGSNADVKQPVKKAERGLEGSVETRIGSLEFDKGFPTDATVEKLYDEMDFQRAVQAYLWGLPMVEMAEWLGLDGAIVRPHGDLASPLAAAVVSAT